MKRRHFLQFAGSTLAALGINALDFQKQGLNYSRVLARSTPRKLALLVGINEYVDENLRLYGCVTDVNLQKEILIHRYGFKESDILTVIDRQATREGIITAFQEHLIKQAQPDDVVVFHYSGHGSEVLDPDKDDPSGKNSTFVPVESSIPATGGGEVIDITGHSLFLLMKAVNTDNLTVVLDSCHSGGGTRGNLRIRARNSGGKDFLMSPKEKEFQARMLKELNLSPQDYIQQRRKGIARGVAIASTQRNQLAADASFGDVNAGAFTYVLTQYLWQMTDDEPVKTILPNVGRTTTKLSSQGQVPLYETLSEPKAARPLYFIDSTLPPAEGVIQKIAGQQARVWLGGIAADNIEAFQSGAIFTIVNDKSQEIGELKLESREGLQGNGTIIKGKAEAGTIVQEKIRSLPEDFTLNIGLDPSLGEDRDKIAGGLNKLQRTKAVPLLKGSVHYIIGKTTRKTGKDDPEIGSLGLFTSGAEPLSGAFGSAGESVEKALTRLQPKLKSLLAARIIKLTLNTDSSKLNVIASMNVEGGKNQLLGKTFPTRGVSQGSATNLTPVTDPSRLPVGTPVQFQIANREREDIYVNIIVIDATGEMSVVFPNQWTSSDTSMLVSAGGTLNVPDPGKGDRFQLVTQEPKGMNEVLIVASKIPLSNALKALQQTASARGSRGGPIGLDDPLQVVESLMTDVNGRSRGIGAIARGVDTDKLATLSISFEVI